MKHKNEINEIYEKMSETFYRTKDYIVVQKIFLQTQKFNCDFLLEFTPAG